MKRSVLLCLFVPFISICFLQTAFADAFDNELQLYLQELNWTKEELVDHLKQMDYSISKFQTVDELSLFLGSSIDNDSLNELLGNYNMTYDDLEMLLAEFGETIDDYKFVKDLEADISFYLQYQEDFTVVNEFLSLFGLTENEMKKLFDHISKTSIDEESKNKISKQLEELTYLQGKDQLTKEDQSKLFSLWDEMMSLLSIDARFYVTTDETMVPIEFFSSETLNEANLHLALHDRDGKVLATLVFTEEMANSHLFYESLAQFDEIAVLADEYRMVLVAKLPATAGHFVAKIIGSLLLLLVGIFLLIRRRRYAIDFS